jgi:hypothetical protein
VEQSPWKADSTHFIEPGGSLPYSQELATVPYHKPDDSIPHPPVVCNNKIHFNFILPTPRPPIGLFPSDFPTNILYAFLISPTRALKNML